MKRFLFLFIFILAISPSWAEINTLEYFSTIEQSKSVEVFINKKGKIIVDSNKVSIKELDKILKNLASKKGTIKFAKASMSVKKVKEATTEFNKLLKKYQIVVYTYTDNTFTKQIIQ